MVDVLDMTPEEVVAKLSEKPELRLAVAKIIARNLATEWRGSQKLSRFGYEACQSTYLHHPVASVHHDERYKAMGEPCWYWGVTRPEEFGWAWSREEALAKCDQLLLAAGFCLAGTVYFNVLKRLAEAADG